jgi:hypothetical protein
MSLLVWVKFSDRNERQEDEIKMANQNSNFFKNWIRRKGIYGEGKISFPI